MRPSFREMVAFTAARSLWILLLVALFGIGGFTVSRTVKRRPAMMEGPFSTTEIFLAHLATPGISEKVIRALREIPTRGSILFLGYGPEPTFYQTYYSLSYLSLPRQLGTVGCGISGNPPSWVRPPADDSGVVRLGGIICYMIPCNPAREITPELLLTFREEPVDPASWPTFCSQ